jgi:hypothetical protein
MQKLVCLIQSGSKDQKREGIFAQLLFREAKHKNNNRVVWDNKKTEPFGRSVLP